MVAVMGLMTTDALCLFELAFGAVGQFLGQQERLYF